MGKQRICSAEIFFFAYFYNAHALWEKPLVIGRLYSRHTDASYTFRVMYSGSSKTLCREHNDQRHAHFQSQWLVYDPHISACESWSVGSARSASKVTAPSAVRCHPCASMMGSLGMPTASLRAFDRLLGDPELVGRASMGARSCQRVSALSGSVGAGR